MANKVYVIIGEPEYERLIRGVFSTREAAEANLVLGDDETIIEEYELDPSFPPPPEGHTLWYVFYDVDEPTTFRVEAFGELDINKVILENERPTVKVWARDQDHALQVGTELLERFEALKPENN